MNVWQIIRGQVARNQKKPQLKRRVMEMSWVLNKMITHVYSIIKQCYFYSEPFTDQQGKISIALFLKISFR